MVKHDGNNDALALSPEPSYGNANMLKNVTDSLLAKGVRMAAAKGGLICPGCGARKTDLASSGTNIFHCAVCGYDGSAGEWLAAKSTGGGEIHVNPDSPPPGTKITRRKSPGGTVEWDIPASGKSGGLLSFAAIWNGFMLLTSAAIIPSALAGNLHVAHGRAGPAWMPAAILLLFWAVGLGMLYAGLRAKYANLRISVGAGEVKMARDMFGRTKTKVLVWKDVTEIQKKVFYQQNYQPVYGVEIKGKGGKLRFGSTLTEEEKSWLVADLRRVVLGETGQVSNPVASEKAVVDEMVTVRPDGAFSVTVPKSSSSLVIAIVLTMLGGSFFALGILVMPGGGLVLPHATHHNIFDWFGLISNLHNAVFRILWFLFSGLFSLVGIGLLVSFARNQGVETKIEGDADRITIRKYKRGAILSEAAFPRKTLRDVRSYNSGSNNGKTMKAVELLFDSHAEKIARWMDGGKADGLAAEIRRLALGGQRDNTSN